MIIYVEKDALEYKQTKRILEKFKNSSIVYIDNYKNIFDKSYKNLNAKKSLVIAKLKGTCLSKIPANYGHTNEGYFFKTSLNCVFNCSYCYLKGAFRNENIVIFVNYEDIKNELKAESGKLKGNYENWFYSSDYSDVLALNDLTNFVEEFVPFFETSFLTSLLPKKEGNLALPMMEIRTKSNNIKPLLDLGFVPKNTEIAFSLNPQILVDKYEEGGASLSDRIKAINKLLNLGFKVGLRFIPLLPVKNYENIYSEFIEYIKQKIDLQKVYSIFVGGLLYTKKDYNKILSKFPNLDILYMLELGDDDFYRESLEIRMKLYEMFIKLDSRCKLCFEKI